MSTIELSISNVGGIDSLDIEFENEITLVAGENATNKTSLLQAILFALGVSDVPIKTDATEARVEMTMDGRSVERVAHRQGTGISITGEAWIDDEDTLLLERFAGLLSTNDLRQAVTQTGDIEQLLKEPMDIERLEQRQQELLVKKREKQQHLDQLEGVESELARKETELEQQRERVNELTSELDQLREKQVEPDEGDEELRELQDERAERVSERTRFQEQVSELENALERSRERLEERREELEAAREMAAETDVADLKQKRDNLLSEMDEVTERVEVFQSVLTANRQMLGSEFTGALGVDASLAGDTYTCWACGQDASTESFESTVEELTELVSEEKQRKREFDPELEDVETEIEAAETARKRVHDLESEVASLETTIEEREESISRKRDQLETVEEAIAELDDRIEERKAASSEKQSDTTAEIEQTRVTLHTAQQDVNRLEDACDDLRDQIEERDRLESELDDIDAEVRELTERIENLEQHIRTEFNEAMADLINVLEFDRIERVWLDGEFDLIIARETGGTVREDSPDHLAESEREMIGLVLGLAGFVAYDVDEVVPMTVLDSLGAFDVARSQRLIEYFGQKTDRLVAAVHPQHAEETDFESIRFESRITS